MLGLLLIYFIGKKFYELAVSYNKSPYLFGVLGVIIYYVGTFVLGAILAVTLGADAIVEMNQLVLSLMALPAGLLSCFLFYKALEKSWSKVKITSDPDILDDFDV